MTMTKTKISTNNLAYALKVISKTVLENKLRPLTSLVHILAENGIVYVEATDHDNEVKVGVGKFEGDDIDVVIDRKKITKILETTTKPTVQLEVEGLKVVMKGNGKYQLDVPSEDGLLPIIFPRVCTDNVEDWFDMPANIDNFKVSKNALPDDDKYQPMFLHYCKDGGQTVTTNGFIVYVSDVDIPFTLPHSAYRFIANTASMAKLGQIDGYVYISDVVSTFKIKKQENEFPLTVVNKIAKFEPINGVAVERNMLIEVLQRLSLFSSEIDKALHLYLDEDNNLCATVGKGTEYLEVDTELFLDCYLNHEKLLKVLKDFTEATIIIDFSYEKFLILQEDGLKVIFSKSRKEV